LYCLLSNKIISLVARQLEAKMAEPIKLKASTDRELGEALEGLTVGQGGWITLEEAQWLFSALDEGDETALSEYDALGLRNLSEFAADFGCSPRRDGDKVFFVKNSG
jgi:hypothetical protein